uniref:uncharacterized protein LOC124061324 isoform X3 n=1 Tax=Scatophagus argus TaxID=75038 RepID=UPI001ED85CB6|nr:uncharacterized protein LOC124061324 isoform X3 [Scatophagus argus]
MTSSGALTGLRTGPVYFFDQPTKRDRIKGTRSIFYFNEADEGAQSAEDTLQSRKTDNKEGTSEELTRTGETHGEGTPDTSSAVGAAPTTKDHGWMDAYKRAAPQLLNELARLLSQHNWAEKRCIPHGIVNILNYSWEDLTLGAVHLKSQDQTDKRGDSTGSLKMDEPPSRQVSANHGREAGERNSCVVEKSVRSKPRVKQHKQTYSRAHNSTTVSLSISSSSCKHPGWIIQPKQLSCDEPEWIGLCQWVAERLQMARNPEKLQTAEEDLNKPFIMVHHYEDTKAKEKHRRARRKTQPAAVVPEEKQQNPARQKLHCRINDGSSFIYYPSGCMAVCQSHSGLPCGGFYTNVFSDSRCPVILATITAFGHGTVTHPVSSAITAVWDQDGGFTYDHHGNTTKEWRWLRGRKVREKIVIQLSDLISVRLFSGTSAMLSFRCNSKSVQLPLSALPNINQSRDTPCLQTEGKLTSGAAQDFILTGRTKSPAVVLESNRTLTPTPVRDVLLTHDNISVKVSVCSREDLQMVRKVEGLEEPSTRWRRGGRVGMELKRLQQKIRSTLDDWLDYYRVAIGIKCPDVKQMPDVPLRTRRKRGVQPAALPSLNSPERADLRPVQPEQDRKELHDLSAPAEKPLDSYVKLPRMPKQGSCVTQIGPLQVHGNISQLKSVIIPNSPDLQPSVVTRCPASPLFTPSSPITTCPALLRAALLGEGGRRRCCCSATLMPALTDLEYDTFIMGQPPHSQQILVVCVTSPHRPDNTQAGCHKDVLEQLYRRRNKHRTKPCTQCQMDSFRLVRYEMSTGNPSCGAENVLLQQRHNAAPGMVLMYIRGKLLFVGYIFGGHSYSVRDLQKQISRTRGDYRLGVSLPSDYKFSDTVKIPAATHAHISQTTSLKGGDDTRPAFSTRKEVGNERKK